MAGSVEETWGGRAPGGTVVVRAVFETADILPVRALLEDDSPVEIEVESGPIRTLRETYLDTRDRRIHRSGCILAVHDLGAGSEVSLEPLRLMATPRPLAPGSPAALASPAPRLPEDCPAPLRGTIRAVAGARKLRPALCLETIRQDVVLKVSARWIATISLVESNAISPPRFRGVRLSRVEIRTPVGRDGEFHPFLEELRDRAGLRSTVASRYESARLAIGEPAPGPGPLGPDRVKRQMSAGEAAFAVLRAGTRKMLGHEPGTRLGVDPEDLHRMRVAVRRMRTLLRLHRRDLPQTILGLDRDLRWIGRVLGPVRDADVQLENLAAWRSTRPAPERAALLPLETRLRAERDRARTVMLEELDSRRYARLVRRLKRRLRAGPGDKPRHGRRPVAEVAPGLVRARRRALRDAGRAIRPDSAPQDYHRVRILAKRFRYCLEFHGALWGEPARVLVERVVRLQDLLGAHQDAAVSLDRLRSLVQAPAELPARTIEAVADWANHREREARRLRRDFAGVFRGTRGSAWKSLRRRLDTRD